MNLRFKPSSLLSESLLVVYCWIIWTSAALCSRMFCDVLHFTMCGSWTLGTYLICLKFNSLLLNLNLNLRSHMWLVYHFIFIGKDWKIQEIYFCSKLCGFDDEGTIGVESESSEIIVKFIMWIITSNLVLRVCYCC